MKLINGLPATVYQRQWRAANPEKVRTYTKNAHIKWGKFTHDRLKQQVYSHYGAGCTCCGETTSAFLSIDHINNDGAQQRRQMGRGRDVLYRWIINNNFPSSFQILCMNCQWGKRKLGTCPHKRGLNG